MRGRWRQRVRDKGVNSKSRRKKERANQTILSVVARDQSGDQNQLAGGILLCFTVNVDSL